VGGADFRFCIGDLVCSRASSELAAQKQTSRLGEDLVNERTRLISTATLPILADDTLCTMRRREQPKHLRLALVYCLWVTAILIALLFARAYNLDSFNVGWGDLAADHRHAVLWWETVAAMALCLGLTVFVGVVSRLALYSIAAAAAILWILALLGAHGPHTYRATLLVPQLPGFFAAVMAVGVHGDEHLTRWWAVSVNTILYAPILYAVVRQRTARATRTEN
jgi:hypothetical protein